MRKLFLILCCALLSTASRAAVIPHPVDPNLFLETTTWTEWYKIDNFYDMTYDQITNSFLPSVNQYPLETNQWHLATLSELQNLHSYLVFPEFNLADAPPLNDPNVSDLDNYTHFVYPSMVYERINQYAAIIGGPGNAPFYFQGFYDASSVPGVNLSLLNYMFPQDPSDEPQWDYYANLPFSKSDFLSDEVGAWVVRGSSVAPEPITMMLFGGGLAGLAIFKRRKT